MWDLEDQTNVAKSITIRMNSSRHQLSVVSMNLRCVVLLCFALCSVTLVCVAFVFALFCVAWLCVDVCCCVLHSCVSRFVVVVCFGLPCFALLCVCVFFNVFCCEITHVYLTSNKFDRKDDLLVDECPPSGENYFLKMTCSGNS